MSKFLILALLLFIVFSIAVILFFINLSKKVYLYEDWDTKNGRLYFYAKYHFPFELSDTILYSIPLKHLNKESLAGARKRALALFEEHKNMVSLSEKLKKDLK